MKKCKYFVPLDHHKQTKSGVKLLSSPYLYVYITILLTNVRTKNYTKAVN